MESPLGDTLIHQDALACLAPLQLYLSLLGLYPPRKPSMSRARRRIVARLGGFMWHNFCLITASSFFIMDIVGMLFPTLGDDEHGSVNKWLVKDSGLPVQLTSDGAVFFPAAQLDLMALVSAFGCLHMFDRLERLLSKTGVSATEMSLQVRRRMLLFGLLHLGYAVGDTACEYLLWQRVEPMPVAPVNTTVITTHRDAIWSPVYFVWLFLWSAPISSLFMLFALICDVHVCEIQSATSLLGSGESLKNEDLITCGSPSTAIPLEEALAQVWQVSCRASKHCLVSSKGCLRSLRFPLLLCAGGSVSLCVDELISPEDRQKIVERLWMYPDLAFVIASVFLGLHAAARVADAADRVILQVNEAGNATAAVTGWNSRSGMTIALTMSLSSRDSSSESIQVPRPLLHSESTGEPSSQPTGVAEASGLVRTATINRPANGAALLEVLRSERQHIEQLKAYLGTLDTGITFSEGARIDFPAIRVGLRLLVTAGIFMVQRMLIALTKVSHS